MEREDPNDKRKAKEPGELSDSGTKIEYNEKDSRYEVRLPWKSQFVDTGLDFQYKLSIKTFKFIVFTFEGSPELLKEYDAYFREQIAKGIIEFVPTSSLTGN